MDHFQVTIETRGQHLFNHTTGRRGRSVAWALADVLKDHPLDAVEYTGAFEGQSGIPNQMYEAVHVLATATATLGKSVLQIGNETVELGQQMNMRSFVAAARAILKAHNELAGLGVEPEQEQKTW